MKKIAIHWFRQDLRLADNPALSRAAAQGALLPIYILDDENAGEFAMGGASRWWLHQSLVSLNKQLDGKLRLYRGKACEILPQLVERFGVDVVSWTRCYEPWRMARDAGISELLTEKGVDVVRHNGSLLWEPWKVKKGDGSAYKVFTPYYQKGCLGLPEPAVPMEAPEKIDYAKISDDLWCLDLEALDLTPAIPKHMPWHEKLGESWDVGESAAQMHLQHFLMDDLAHYQEGRDFPAKAKISQLSAYLHWGQLSPNQVWHAVKHQDHLPEAMLGAFLRQLAWREFSYYLLFHHHALPSKGLKSRFDDFPWVEDSGQLQAWQQGRTGIPIVDAGMRELWQTGFMHNRVRMIVASFLVKNLRIDWREGARWFHDCLVDADLASNSASWQWVAGCGTDAAPYFRIFNPVLQGQKFDPGGLYVRKYVPELRDLPTKYLFNPWEAPLGVLNAADIELGVSYPIPIVDLKKSRQLALDAYQSTADAGGE